MENVEQERNRLHDQWRLKLERAQHEVDRAERRYHSVEPENRLVARTLEARWEDALQQQRQVEEDYHRFLAKLPATLNATDRERIRELSDSVDALWHAAETSAQDRKQIIRCLVERVVVVADKSSEHTEVTIIWQGGLTTQHQVARPVGSYEQLKDYKRLTERITEFHRAGLHLAEIAEKLNAEGFVPARRRGVFTESGVGTLLRHLGLVAELFRDDLLADDEWWIPDLARQLGVIPQKIHYWVKQGWIHARRAPSGKHWIVWADKEEKRRLQRLAKHQSSWIAARNPDLVIPKKRPKR
jgi:hypothetical protein